MKIEPRKADMASQELLDLSRLLRQAREEVEEVRRQLRCHSQLEECRRQLKRQEDNLSLSTAKVVDMSCALREIADLYRAAEEKNVERLEERTSASRIRGDIVVFAPGSGVSDRIRTIINQ